MNEIDIAAQMACHDVYDPVTEGVFDSIIVVNEDVVGVKRVSDAVWIVPAGTENTDGWINDIDILTGNMPGLGCVHAGFNQNVKAIFNKVLPLLKVGDVIKIAGHSRGAPIGAMVGTLLKLLGFDVRIMYLFESPKFCFHNGADWLSRNIPNIVYTRCVAKWLPLLGDPVTMVPEPTPWQPWCEPAPQTTIYGNPKGLLKLSAVAYHAGQVVIDAVAAMSTSKM